MEWLSWAATVVAAAVAFASAGVAIWQASLARQSAVAAIDQAQSARRSADTAEAARSFEKLKELQAARKLLNLIEASTTGAIRDAAGVGTQKSAELLSAQMVKAAHEFRYMPIATAIALREPTFELHDSCASLHKTLNTFGYALWANEDERPAALMASARIEDLVEKLLVLIEAEITSIWQG